MGNLHNQGGRRCQGIGNGGQRCGNSEVEGLEFCVQHVPDDMLEEAEEVTGVRRCRHHFGYPDACHFLATEGTDPATCKNHGANTGSVIGKRAATAVVEGKAQDRLIEIMREGGESLLTPPRVEDPLQELLAAASEMKALKELLRKTAGVLFEKGQYRYAHSKMGEQARMEILLYERAMERFVKVLLDISKLKIDDRLAGIRQQTADALERALNAALEDSGIGLDGQAKAREAFQRHLKVVA